MVILANGAQLGWLQNPEQRAVEIWCASNVPGAAPERLEPPVALLADPLLAGLQPELAELWAA
jgi:Uma2 family endonuclease